MRHIKEFLSNDFSPILEMARININDGLKYDVFVYGGNSYGIGRNEHGEPHFHFADKIKGGKFQFSILIPGVIDWQQSKELYIIESSNDKLNWAGFKTEKKDLIEWLDKPNVMIGGVLTNIQVIRQQWNLLNTDNKNVKQLVRIK